jgi:exopolysaccharide biosynthesis polyprenyl glycosylphosphotransferase
VLRRRYQLYVVTAVATDLALVALAWMSCYVIRFHSGWFPMRESSPPDPLIFVRLLPLVIGGDFLALGVLGLYSAPRPRGFWRELADLSRASVLGWLFILASFYYISARLYSRRLLFLFFFANVGALVLSRVLARDLLGALYRRGIGVRNAAVIGTGRLGQEVLFRLRRHDLLGLRAMYFIEEGDAVRREEVHGVPVLGATNDLVGCLKRHPVDTVFVAVSGRDASVEDILSALADLPINVSVVPDFSRAAPLSFSVDDLDGLPLVHLRGAPLDGWRALVKRGMDLLGALSLLVIFAMPMLLLALLVKLSGRGAVFFRQERMGLGGRPFMLLKFRSMREGAERESGPVWATREDPRRTWMGRLMRRASLDELPQLFNVLKGDMSLVGPRPERPHFVDQFVGQLPGYMLRHNIKAGLTGWAQVNGLRGNTSVRKRLQYDLYYINHWSLGFDLLILLLTPFSGMVSRDAY